MTGHTSPLFANSADGAFPVISYPRPGGLAGPWMVTFLIFSEKNFKKD